MMADWDTERTTLPEVNATAPPLTTAKARP
jgi:hypothetical protein